MHVRKYKKVRYRNNPNVTGEIKLTNSQKARLQCIDEPDLKN